jgi:hypothetical protein
MCCFFCHEGYARLGFYDLAHFFTFSPISTVRAVVRLCA